MPQIIREQKRRDRFPPDGTQMLCTNEAYDATEDHVYAGCKQDRCDQQEQRLENKGRQGPIGCLTA